MPEQMGEKGKNTEDFHYIRVTAPEVALERVLQLVTHHIPRAFHLDPSTMSRSSPPCTGGECGIDALNRALQERLNPRGQPVRSGEREFRVGDKVIQLRNDYQREVFNGEIGRIRSTNPETGEIRVDFDGRIVEYGQTDLNELALAYCISIHKSQGSEYPAIVVPLVAQHFIMLQRNLLYTAVTRARDLVCLVGHPRPFPGRAQCRAPAPPHRPLLPRPLPGPQMSTAASVGADLVSARG